MTINELKSLLSKFHIRPSHKLGQNFLLSEEVLDQIVDAADLSGSDTVLEIGPGLGVLTCKLSERAGLVLAVEKDRKLVAALRKIFKNKKNVKVMQGDALFFDPTAYNLTATTYKLIANIPYYITGKLLQNFLSASQKPSHMVLLLQKEVAERIVAKPGQMSLLSVSVQYYAEPEIVSVVPKENFYPAPEVDSAVIKIKMLEKPRFDVNDKKFFHLVKIGFSGKRKQLHNNLSAAKLFRHPEPQAKDLRDSSADANRLQNDKSIDYKKLLIEININPQARAQDLSIGEWERLYNKIFNFQ